MHELTEAQSKCFPVTRESYANELGARSSRRDKVSPYLSELGDVLELWGENSVGGDDGLQRGGEKKQKRGENAPSHVRAEQNRRVEHRGTGGKVLPRRGRSPQVDVGGKSPLQSDFHKLLEL